MSTTSFDMPIPTGEGWGNGLVFPVFHRMEKPMSAESAKEGVPLTRSIDMVKIVKAGEHDDVVEEVHGGHKARWPKEWEAYQSGIEQVTTGTPLELLFPGDPGVVSDLKRNNIFSIQALAGIPDSAETNIPFLPTWKKRAKDFMDVVEKGKPLNDLTEALKARDTKIDELTESLLNTQKQLSNLMARLSEDDEEPKRRPGRPTNAEVAARAAQD